MNSDTLVVVMCAVMAVGGLLARRWESTHAYLKYKEVKVCLKK